LTNRIRCKKVFKSNCSRITRLYCKKHLSTKINVKYCVGRLNNKNTSISQCIKPCRMSYHSLNTWFKITSNNLKSTMPRTKMNYCKRLINLKRGLRGLIKSCSTKIKSTGWRWRLSAMRLSAWKTRLGKDVKGMLRPWTSSFRSMRRRGSFTNSRSGSCSSQVLVRPLSHSPSITNKL
jgi:hypothetical protein